MAISNVNYAAGQDSMQDVFDKINDTINAVNPTAWTAVTFTNGWSEDATMPVKYRKINDIVYLQGNLNNATASNTAAFTLPVGFRPVQACSFAVTDANNLANVPSSVMITTAGVVVTTITEDKNLDGISFSITA